jgi:peptidoglycan/LPS O-acetylase OafA/YrhL
MTAEIASTEPFKGSILLDDSKRIVQLDGIRAIAILMVLVWHYFNGDCIMTNTWSPVAHIIRRLGTLNWSGVDLFFVLSGFLLGGILLDNHEARNYFRIFYLRRACRILPIYYVIFGIFVMLKPVLQHSGSLSWLCRPHLPLWPYLIFAQNIVMGLKESPGPAWMGMTWSLAVEEHFYLVLPLLIYFVPRRALLYVLALFVFAAQALRCLSPGFHAFVNMPWRADSLLAGVTLAVLVRSRRFTALANSSRHFILTLFSILFGGAILAILSNFHTSSQDPYNHLWLAALYTVFILVAIMEADRFIGRILKIPILAWVGTVSYGVYLLHEQVLGLLFGCLQGHEPHINSLADAMVTVLALAITFGLAALSYYFFEKPILRYGHKMKYQHNSSPSTNRQPTPLSPETGRITIRPLH